MMASFVSVACAQQSNLPETYSKKVLIEAKWGDGPGEFGLSNTDMGPSGPTDFTVAPNGEIYILDNMGINVRIAKYDATGAFQDYMYLYQAPLQEHKTEQERINYRYGHILSADYQNALVRQIAVDNQGNLYLYQMQFGKIIQKQWNGRKLGEISGIPRGRLKYEKSGLFVTEGFITADGCNKWDLLDNNSKLKNNFKNIPKAKSAATKIKVIEPPDTRQSLFFIDEYSNYYYYTYFTKTEKIKVYKYNGKGALLSIIEVVENRGDMYAAPFRSELMYISDRGDIYYFIARPEGARLVKWQLESK